MVLIFICESWVTDSISSIVHPLMRILIIVACAGGCCSRKTSTHFFASPYSSRSYCVSSGMYSGGSLSIEPLICIALHRSQQILRRILSANAASRLQSFISSLRSHSFIYRHCTASSASYRSPNSLNATLYSIVFKGKNRSLKLSVVICRAVVVCVCSPKKLFKFPKNFLNAIGYRLLRVI